MLGLGVGTLSLSGRPEGPGRQSADPGLYSCVEEALRGWRFPADLVGAVIAHGGTLDDIEIGGVVA
jgi:hypothetical protein